MTEASAAIKRAESKEEKTRLQMQMMGEMRAAGYRPFRPILFAFVQIPFYITAFRAQSVLVQLRAEETAVGGALWFTDLHVPDATYGLPVLSSIMMLASFELGAEGIAEKYRRMFRLLMRTFAVVSIPLVGWLPAGTCVFILSHNILFRLLVALDARSGIPRVARAAGDAAQNHVWRAGAQHAAAAARDATLLQRRVGSHRGEAE
jgi:membrane protein insertase Oxa1/YidC/SpoIIIJ